jgi:hypothetical protein
VSTPVALKYHQVIFDMLGWSPVVCDEATRLIGEAERQWGRRLPGSVREWNSLSDAVALIPRWWHPRPLESVLTNFRSGGRIALGAGEGRRQPVAAGAGGAGEGAA